MHSLISYVCGIIFGLGLVISNMTNPNKVLNFLDITGVWDPSLLVLMASALVISFIGYKIAALYMKKPFFHHIFSPQPQIVIDKRLVIGSIIFGIGWGIGGYCPGPDLTSISMFRWDPMYYIVSMITGSYLTYWFLDDLLG